MDGAGGSALSFESQTWSQHRECLIRADALDRRWASSLLLVGTVTGLLSFVLATAAGTFNSMVGDNLLYACFPKSECPSGRSYHAETVSEMVSKSGTPASHLFYAFSVTAALCLLMSKYPWHFSNVYTNSGCGLFAVAAVRSVLPPLGMLIVAQVPVVPRHERSTLAIQLNCAVHTLGAVLFVAGYNLLEWHALCRLRHKLDSCELRLRFVCMVLSSCFMISFVLCGAMYGMAKPESTAGLCCADKYEDIHKLVDLNGTQAYMEELVIEKYGKNVLTDSAHGLALLVKKLEFWSEELCGVFIIASHLVIWWYSDCTTISVPDMA